jgi:hypothetical protein
MNDPGIDWRLNLCVVQLDGIPRAYARNDNLWIPAEPLIDPAASATPVRSTPRLSARSLFATDKPDVYKKIDEQSGEAVASHLGRILSFLRNYDVDVAVFPEYLTPINCLPALIDFSLGRVVVAGLGQARGSSQAAYLAKMSGGQKKVGDLIQRNVSVLVTDGHVHLITKKEPSKGETMEPGTGPIVEEVDLRGRKVRLGVAVCMDYLRHEEDVRKQQPDIVCIPAYSHGLKSFKPDAPRDYVRLFSNGAVYGGSQIMIPELHGIMTDELGVRPIEAGFEAVILVAYDQYPKVPTGLLGTNNQLLLRAGIIERTLANEAALDAIADLTAYATEEERPVAHIVDHLARWLSRISTESPIGQILEVYREILAEGTENARIDELALSHLVLEPGNRPSAVRRRQAEYIISQLRTLSTDKPIGGAEDEYYRLLGRLTEAASDGANTHAVEHVNSAYPLSEKPTAGPGMHNASASSSGDIDSSASIRYINSDSFESFGADLGVHPAEAERLRICRDIEGGVESILSAVSKLAASASPSDLQLAAQTCRFRVASVADLLTQLTRLTSARSDFEWINATGMVTQSLTKLQDKLPSNDGEARSAMAWRAGLTPLSGMVSALHEAAVNLRTLAG